MAMTFHNRAFLTLFAGLSLAACEAEPLSDNEAKASISKPKLGLMTSLPIYWPLGAGLDELASGKAETPWQRTALEARFELVLLDTLSPVSQSPVSQPSEASLDPDAPAIDPLADIDRLAVIQPRVLTPSDNIALDQWVRQGGKLLLVLDPALAGHFDLPLGDPRSPVEAALIPPVLSRWGLDMQFDEAQSPIREITLGETRVPVVFAGTLVEIKTREDAGEHGDCRILGEGLMAKCALGEGRVSVIADAEAFLEGHSSESQTPESHTGHNHTDHADTRSNVIQALAGFAFEGE